MGWEAFEKGDILIQARAHAVMWVGGLKPIVHNVDAGKFTGVIQQSSDYVGKATHRVFRYRDSAIATVAAEFAEAWAAKPGDSFQMPDHSPEKIVLKTPYSHRRMGEAFNGQGAWTVESLFRALKAVARRRDGMGLSPAHGTSCSQFVTFCYQAAALEAALGTSVLPPDLVGAVRGKERTSPFDIEKWAKVDATDKYAAKDKYWRDKTFQPQQKVFLSLKQDSEFIANALGKWVDQAKVLLPGAMQVDAKTMEVERLLDSLDDVKSDFKKIGLTKFNQEKNAYMIETA